jgi:hypothetical protein
MAAYYSVAARPGECRVVVRARDADAKQVLFSWADGRPGGGAELYGRGTGRGSGGAEIWEWRLSRAGLAALRSGLAAQRRAPRQYGVTRGGAGASRELAKKIAVQARKLRGCRVRRLWP